MPDPTIDTELDDLMAAYASEEVDPMEAALSKKEPFVPPQADFPAPVSGMEAGARGLMSGLTMGFGDNIAAGLGAMAGGDYKKQLAMERARNIRGDLSHPLASSVGKGIGSAASAATIPGGLATKLGVSGAASSLGDSDDASDPTNLAVAGATGAVSGLAGGALGLAGRGLSRLAVRAPKFAEAARVGGEAFHELELDGAGSIVKDGFAASPLTNKMAYGLSNDALPLAAGINAGPLGVAAARGLQSPVYQAAKGLGTSLGIAGHAVSSPVGRGSAAAAMSSVRDMALQRARSLVGSKPVGTPQNAEHQKQMMTNQAYREAYNKENK